MNGYCPNCEKEETLILVKGVEEFNIRGEIIPIEVEFYRCKDCGEKYFYPREDYDPLEIAYEEYRRRKEWIQPETIREFRKKYGLTQKELSDLLGIGIATLSRYENGALQDEAHDRILQLGMSTQGLLHLINKNPHGLNQERRQQIINELKHENEEKLNWLDLTVEIYGNYEPSFFSGFRKFDLDKFFQCVKFFCYPNGVYKTKLTKMLFYTDFKHYKEYSVSITGSQYAHLPFGPVPNNFETWFTLLINKDASILKEEVWKGDYPGEVFQSNEYPDLSVFSPSELKILAMIKEKFQTFSAKDIRDFSHNEKGYQETKNSELISYQYAEYLQL